MTARGAKTSGVKENTWLNTAPLNSVQIKSTQLNSTQLNLSSAQRTTCWIGRAQRLTLHMALHMAPRGSTRLGSPAPLLDSTHHSDQRAVWGTRNARAQRTLTLAQRSRAAWDG